ncbi:MAG TPA: LysM peptidoglycan-binding domain-containing protein, partial [Flavobacteriales bacterium]|nr:LysM peptidoglycan-binding domain-containing protein [Flavobacteriales bacterium]
MSMRGQELRHINGHKYKVHVVEQGQTLYAIARVHAVPVDALIEANPGASLGLRLGQELLIPVSAVVKKEAKSAPSLMEDGELRHIAAKKETMFGIAARYHVDVNELITRNPALATGLKEGMEVIIPVSKVAGVKSEELRPADASTVVDHIVQPGETLFALSKRYGVKPEEIQAANGGLAEGLKAGGVIHIPKEGMFEVVQPVTKDSTLVRERYHIALLLPFSVARNDSTLTASASDPNGAHFYEMSRIAAQFYAGAQLALDSLSKQGLNAEVTVLDVGDDQRNWGTTLKSSRIADVDLFIGPFHRSAIEQLARSNSRAHIVCPVPQSNKVLLGNPNVSKVAPGRSDLVKHAARYVAQRHASDNVMMVKPEIV